MANNQYINKVVFGNNTLIDLSSDTVNPGVLVTGYTAHDQTGASITGTVPYGTPNIGFDSGTFKIQFSYGLYSGSLTVPNISIPVPSSGTNSIIIKVPNGTTTPSSSDEGDWIPITFTVDSSGNSELIEDISNATGVSF